MWAHTEGDRLMPVDPVVVEGGNLELIERGDGTLTAIVHPAGASDLFGGDRYVSHFASCPDSESWRREHGIEPVRFDGTTVSEDPDATARLSGQMLRVFSAVSDGAWWTLDELARAAAPATEAAVSARLRDLRKARNGAHTVERQLVGPGRWAYRLLIDEHAGTRAR